MLVNYLFSINIHGVLYTLTYAAYVYVCMYAYVYTLTDAYVCSGLYSLQH